MSDKKFLKSSAWLNCRLIVGCQQLLHDAFPQILNVYKSHWISVSNIGCEANTIMFMIVPTPP